MVYKRCVNETVGRVVSDEQGRVNIGPRVGDTVFFVRFYLYFIFILFIVRTEVVDSVTVELFVGNADINQRK